MSCEKCSKGSCPFADLEESEIVQNYGCLPTKFDIVVMKLHHGKTWACHSNPSKPCLGASRWFAEREVYYQKYNLRS